MRDVISIFALLISISGFTWTIWYNLRRTSHEKTTRTIDLNVLFYQNDMVFGREIAWHLVDSLEESQALSLTFKSLWDSNDMRVRDEFRSLYKVLSFWLTIYELGNGEKIDKKLASRLFTYEYEWWYWRLEKLVKDTPMDDHPDVFQPFVRQGIDWMPRKNKHESEPRSRKVRAK